MLFVHGVGRHSPLSSLLRAYQSLRANLLSPEAPIEAEDEFQDWKLRKFEEGSHPAYLELVPLHPEDQPASAVYLYEVNYSAVAGVIRENHRLDMTHLFVSLDLAVIVARGRLAAEAKRDPGGLEQHLELARIAQGLAGVLVAATVPVLGIPSLVLRKWMAPFVDDFVRFFEDIATFAIDRNGEALISAHVDQTIDAIAARRKRDPTEASEFVVVAHSLGSVVMHSFLVTHWRDWKLPSRMITLGSPIGLVTWLWRFLDFRRLELGLDRRYDDPYFCWTPKAPPDPGGAPLEWLNVVNHLDPIATAFPDGDVYVNMPPQQLAQRLVGGVQHHYMPGGGLLSLGVSHTRYYDDPAFLQLLGHAARLILPKVEPPPSLPAADHWRRAKRHLSIWRWGSAAAGLALMLWYLSVLASGYGSPTPYALMALYAWPPFVIGTLAFFQRLLHGGPTKRTRWRTIDALPFADWVTIPYFLRQDLLRLGREDRNLMHERAGPVASLLLMAVSFVPSLVVMAIPVWWMAYASGNDYRVFDLVEKVGYANLPLLVGLFMAYTIAFAASELARHWRKALEVLGV